MLYSEDDLTGAEDAYRAALAIAEALVARDPANTLWQSDLSFSYVQIGDVLLAKGDLPGAEAAYRAALEIDQTLAAQDPAKSDWQIALSIGHDKIGDVLMAQDNLAGAEAAYRAGLSIRETLALRDNGSVEAQLDLVDSLYNLSFVSADPRTDLEAALAILTKLKSEGRLSPDDESWIWMVEDELAALSPDPP